MKMLIVTWQGLTVRVGFKFEKLAWTAPFQVACRSLQTCKKSASLKSQRASFQVSRLIGSLFSESKTDTPDTSRYSPAKDKTWRVTCWCVIFKPHQQKNRFYSYTVDRCHHHLDFPDEVFSILVPYQTCAIVSNIWSACCNHLICDLEHFSITINWILRLNTTYISLRLNTIHLLWWTVQISFHLYCSTVKRCKSFEWHWWRSARFSSWWPEITHYICLYYLQHGYSTSISSRL